MKYVNKLGHHIYNIKIKKKKNKRLCTEMPKWHGNQHFSIHRYNNLHTLTPPKNPQAQKK